MGTVHVYLENGFEHDRVVVGVGAREVVEPDATTRHQIGLAAVIELAVPDGVASRLRVALPARGMLAETDVDPALTPHVRVSVGASALVVQSVPDPPRFA